MDKKFSRRQIFKFSLIGVGSVPFVYAVLASWGFYPRREGFGFLSSKEVAIVEALGEAIIPPDNVYEIRVQDAGLAHGVDELMLQSDEFSRDRLRVGLWSIEHVLPGFSFYFSKFTNLPLEHRQKILTKYEQSTNVASRALLRSLKGLVQTIYYNHPKVAAKIEFIEKCRS